MRMKNIYIIYLLHIINYTIIVNNDSWIISASEWLYQVHESWVKNPASIDETYLWWSLMVNISHLVGPDTMIYKRQKMHVVTSTYFTFKLHYVWFTCNLFLCAKR